MDSHTIALYDDLIAAAISPAYTGSNLVFKEKKVKGKTYLYLRLRLGGREAEKFLGEDTPAIRSKIEAEKKLWEQNKPTESSRQRIVSQLLIGGMYAPPKHLSKVLAVVARSGVFHSGGVLVGTLAFQTYNNMLGSDMTKGNRAAMTRDVDIAEARNVCLAAPDKTIPLSESIMDSGLGFFEVPAQSLRVDLVTPSRPAGESNPVFIKAWNTYASPLKHLDYLLEDVAQAVILYGQGIYVNVPNPARYALHKLYVAGKRPVVERGKSQRDREQAHLLLAVLAEERPGDIHLALDAAEKQGKQFFKSVCEGLATAGYTKFLPQPKPDSESPSP